ncbi:hypothetical protein [Algoriphagus sp. A40]|uniref:hypothetical protein n=1 Tax=Algoriphagus sp. A40 TaxID=1945863 RepID=UPI0009840FCE|nr:hypothetical protein [Algoriphagus sp. A40]OOG74834.1 hypothetical protein B0E43_10640 [Algoriphagus sp. A40]
MITEENRRELIDWISSLENQFMLQHLMELKNSTESDRIYMVSDQERIAIKEGIESFKKEGGVSHDEVLQLTKKKYPNLFKNKLKSFGQKRRSVTITPLLTI